MHTSVGMDLPNNFLMPEIRKLGKNLVYFGLYRRDLLGELHQAFLRDVSLQQHKTSASDFGGPTPPKFWGRKRSFNYAILRFYCKYLHTGTRYRRLKNGLQTAIPPVHAYQIWCTLVYKMAKMGPFYNSVKINFFGRSYLRG